MQVPRAVRLTARVNAVLPDVREASAPEAGVIGCSGSARLLRKHAGRAITHFGSRQEALGEIEAFVHLA